ncbi:MAG TPA: hypothetical protein VGB73_20545 [Pyrinomonadaceae bacterium]|jgi:hypothetical protein
MRRLRWLLDSRLAQGEARTSETEGALGKFGSPVKSRAIINQIKKGS